MDTAAALARAASVDLAVRLDLANLPLEVEKRLAAGNDDTAAPKQMPALETVLVVAGFVLTCAQFAYTIYQDQRDHGQKPDKAAIKQRLALEVRSPASIAVETRDDVIRVVVDQLPGEPRT